MIKKGRLFRVTTITDPEAKKNKDHLWRVIDVIGEIAFIQPLSEKSKGGSLEPLTPFSRDELENCKFIKPVKE